jgi:glycosyltransferase involved in cell wall biosynthesis
VDCGTAASAAGQFPDILSAVEVEAAVPRRALRVGMVVCSEYESDARVRRQAEALAARGDDVTVYALNSAGRPRSEIIDGVRVIRSATRKYRGSSARAYLSLYGGFVVRAAAWLGRRPRSFDIVQAHSMPEALIFAAAVQSLNRVPLLLDIHDLSEQLFASKFRPDGALMSVIRVTTRSSLRFADEVITVHESYADTVRAMTRRRVSVVMNCPDDRLFKPRQIRPWTPGGRVVFAYHGLIAPRHGLINAIDALHALRTDVPGAELILLGGGDGLDAVRERVAELGLTDVVSVPDRPCPVTEVVARLGSVDIGLVPSQRDPWTDEVLPTKLLEYATLGIPVITFRNPVIERYFPDDAVTFVDPASPENLRAAMLALVKDPERARKQVERAWEVMSELSWERQRRAYFEVIDRMTSRRSSRPGQRRATRRPRHARTPGHDRIEAAVLEQG